VGSAALGRSRGTTTTTPAGTGGDASAGGRTYIDLPSAGDDDTDDAEPSPPSPVTGDGGGDEEKGDSSLDREGTSVVDEQLNVRNVLSLRIAGTSFFFCCAK